MKVLLKIYLMNHGRQKRSLKKNIHVTVCMYHLFCIMYLFCSFFSLCRVIMKTNFLYILRHLTGFLVDSQYIKRVHCWYDTIELVIAPHILNDTRINRTKRVLYLRTTIVYEYIISESRRHEQIQMHKITIKVITSSKKLFANWKAS